MERIFEMVRLLAQRLRGLAAHAPVDKTSATAIGVAGALLLWILSGVIGDDRDDVEMATPIDSQAVAQIDFRVSAQILEAETYKARVKLQARTEADRVVTIASETSGTIEALPVSKGSFVKRGDLVCKIDTGARAALLAEASAMRDAREIEFDAARRLAQQGHTSKSQEASARAAYDAAVALVKARQVELAYTEIRAPFDGIIDKLPLRTGSFIDRGRACATIIDKDPLLVVAHVSESQINDITAGAAGGATLATGEKVKGFVRYVAETPSTTTRTFRIELEIDNATLDLHDGISAEMEIEAGDVMATRIRQSSLTLDDAGRLGVRVLEGNRVAFRPVDVLADVPDGAWVTGLGARETVITVGQEYIRAGQEIEAVIENSIGATTPDDTAAPSLHRTSSDPET